MSFSQETSLASAERFTSFRIGEIARTVTSRAPDKGAPDNRAALDIANSIPIRSWQLENVDPAIREVLLSVRKNLVSTFNILIDSRNDVAHGDLLPIN
jgi:hypothetical protein